MSSFANGLLLLLLFAWFVTQGKYLGLAGMGVGLLVLFLLLAINEPAPLSFWETWALLVGAFACQTTALFRAIRSPALPVDGPSKGRRRGAV